MPESAFQATQTCIEHWKCAFRSKQNTESHRSLASLLSRVLLFNVNMFIEIGSFVSIDCCFRCKSLVKRKILVMDSSKNKLRLLNLLANCRLTSFHLLVFQLLLQYSILLFSFSSTTENSSNCNYSARTWFNIASSRLFNAIDQMCAHFDICLKTNSICFCFVWFCFPVWIPNLILNASTYEYFICAWNIWCISFHSDRP